MNRISTSEDSIIEAGSDHWHLLQSNEYIGETTLLEAVKNQALQFNEDFARTRHLPENGTLPVSYIRRVVAGWSHQDSSWHLGLILAQDFADARGSRWCEIVSWLDPEQGDHMATVNEAGQALAQILSLQFALIPPHTQSIQQLPELPLESGNWKLTRTESDSLQLSRSRRWELSRLLRIVWYTFWVIVYVALSAATLSADLALPNAGAMLPDPSVLPYLGLVTAAVLSIMLIYSIFSLITSTNRIMVDSATKSIIGMRGRSKHWSKSGQDIEAIYVTQVVDSKRKKNTTYHGELNLHLGNDKFQRILQHTEEKGKNSVNKDDNEKLEEAILPISPTELANDLQAIGLHLAQALGELPCWYDQRVR
jgi:hypothetical protein